MQNIISNLQAFTPERRIDFFLIKGYITYNLYFYRMKRILTLIILIFLTNNLIFSQDVLLFEDGRKKDVKVLEVTPEIVKYSKFNSTSKVVYTENKYNLIGVIFEDGEFEKFESRRGGSSTKSNFNQGDYGSNMLYVGPLDLFYGVMLNIGYEHYTKSGRSSIKIPLRVVLGGSYSDFYGSGNSIYDFWKIGFEHKFFPTGSNGVVRGFMGYGVHYGSYGYENIYAYDYNYYYYNIEYSEYYNVQFMGGIQIHPSELINFILDVGIGPAIEVVDDYVMRLWPSFSTTIGFRF